MFGKEIQIHPSEEGCSRVSEKTAGIQAKGQDEVGTTV